MIFFDKEYSFALQFTKIEDHWIDFRVLEVIAHYEENNVKFICYRDKNRMTNGDCIDINEAEEICTGFIKWDGCMELHNLGYHFCGYDNILQRLVKLIYLKAKEVMVNFDEDLACIENIDLT